MFYILVLLFFKIQVRGKFNIKITLMEEKNKNIYDSRKISYVYLRVKIRLQDSTKLVK